MVNKLPNIDTDVPSNLSFRGEIAYLKPGASKADQFNGEATTYIDDFEGSQTTIDMRSPQAWTLSSVPLEGDYDGVATTAEPSTDDLSVGYKRSKLAWYSIDPVFIRKHLLELMRMICHSIQLVVFLVMNCIQ